MTKITRDMTADRAARERAADDAIKALQAVLATADPAPRGEASAADTNEPITLNTIGNWRRELVLQARLEDGSLMRWRAIENPRLEITRIVRRGQGTTTTFVVDGHTCTDIDDVLRRLNEPQQNRRA